MKYKITNIDEPVNENELQKVKDAKDFNRSLIGLVASTTVGFVGIALYTSNVGGDLSAIPVALGVFMQGFSHGVINPKLIGHLNELYNKKRNEQEKDNTLSGGMKR